MVQAKFDKIEDSVRFSSVTQSCLTLRPHGLQHARPPCPSPSPRVYSNSCPLSRWCHPTISSSVVTFSSCFQSFPASGSFQMSQLFTSIPKYWRFSFSISPSNDLLDWFPLGWTGLISLPSKGLSRFLSSNTEGINSLALSLFYYSAIVSIHDYRKNHSLTRWTFVGKVVSAFKYAV